MVIQKVVKPSRVDLSIYLWSWLHVWLFSCELYEAEPTSLHYKIKFSTQDKYILSGIGSQENQESDITVVIP